MSSEPNMRAIQHIALIPDGNRRFASKHGNPTSWGHIKGAEAFRPVLRAALDMHIPSITVWGSSLSNITKRTAMEVEFLVNLFGAQARELLGEKEIFEQRVRVQVLGRWRELFPKSVVAALEELMEKTAHHDRHVLTILLAYSGTDEMTAAVQDIAKTKPDTIDAQTIKQHLWTKDLPPVDLVIRTGGEPHWSAGFMMWDVAEARLHFTPTLWPEFSPEEFTRIVSEHEGEERRFGK